MKRYTTFLLSPVLLAVACGSADAPVELTADSGMDRGEQVFRMNCVLCHGADGKLGFNGAKDLTKSTLSKEEMVARVREGKGTMMAYKNVLSAKDIEAVVAHVRSLPKTK